MTIRERLLALKKRREALSQMVARFEAEREEALASLPRKFGYESLGGFLAALKEAQAPKKRRYRRRAVKTPRKAEAIIVAAATRQEAPAKAHTAPTAVPGSDLSDPRNFGVLPDLSFLDTPSAPDAGYYDRLSQALAYGRRVLGTSGVPAAVWREWRAYEQRVSDLLRNRHGHDPAGA